MGLDNFVDLFDRSAVSATPSAEPSSSWQRSVLLSMSLALFLAVFADREIRGRGVYRTLLIWPYAIAPAMAAVLWLFVAAAAHRNAWSLVEPARHRLGLSPERTAGDADGRRWPAPGNRSAIISFFSSPACSRSPASVTGGRADGRRQRLAQVPHHHISVAGADDIFPHGGQPGLCRVRHFRRRSRR